MLSASLALVLSTSFAAPVQAEVQPIGDSIRRAANETEKFYGRQWQMAGETLKVALVEPGNWLRYTESFTTETVHFVFAGQNNTSKLEMNIVDPVTKKIVEKCEQDSLGGIYFMPKKGKAYMIEVLNSGLRDDFVSVVQVVGGLGAQLPLSKYKFLASSSGHAMYDMAKAGEITFPLNSSFFKAAVIPAKGSFTASISLTKANSQVIGFGEEDTLKVKAAVIDGSNKALKQLQDDGSGARFLTLPKGLPSAKKIRFTNPTSKRIVYSWAVVTKN